jgi:hypothetical protein
MPAISSFPEVSDHQHSVLSTVMNFPEEEIYTAELRQ